MNRFGGGKVFCLCRASARLRSVGHSATSSDLTLIAAMGCLTDLLRGRDPDEIFAYYTTKKIMLKDRRLGLLNKVFMFAILPVKILHYYDAHRILILDGDPIDRLYIVVYQLWMSGSYFTRDAPTGTVRFSLWSPAEDSSGNPCRMFKDSGCTPIATAPCPSGLTCKDWDGVEAGHAEQASMLVTTRVGIYTGVGGVGTNYFIKGIEDFTLSVDHSIFVMTKGGNPYHEARNGMSGGLLRVSSTVKAHKDLCTPEHFARDDHWPGSGAYSDPRHGHDPCYIRPDSWGPACEDACNGQTICDSDGNLELAKEKAGDGVYAACFQDVFKVSTLLGAAGLDLDTPNSAGTDDTTRYTGTIINLITSYTNIKQWKLGVTERMNYYYNVTVQQGAEYKAVDRLESGEYRDYHGLYFRYIASGYVGDGDVLSFLITMTVSLSLFGTATVIIDLLTIYILPEKALYRAARRSFAEHLIATKALRCTATAWMLIVAQCSAIP